MPRERLGLEGRKEKKRAEKQKKKKQNGVAFQGHEWHEWLAEGGKWGEGKMREQCVCCSLIWSKSSVSPSVRCWALLSSHNASRVRPVQCCPNDLPSSHLPLSSGGRHTQVLKYRYSQRNALGRVLQMSCYEVMIIDASLCEAYLSLYTCFLSQ